MSVQQCGLIGGVEGPEGSSIAVHLRESVSLWEMCNNSGELLRRVAEGESVLITNGGVPTAVMVPAGIDARTRLIAVGRLRPGTGLDLGALPEPVRSTRLSDDLLVEGRG